MTLRQRCRFLVPLGQVCLVILAIAPQTAEAAFTFLSTADTLPVRDAFAAVWTDLLVPEFKEIALL